MINSVHIVGYLGKDPESRATRAGTAIASFSVATTQRWKDRQGQKQESTEWHNVICWAKTAEIAGKYLTKGQLVYVIGHLQTDTWEDRKTGKKMYRTQIVCDRFQMLGGRPGERQTRESARREPDQNRFDDGGSERHEGSTRASEEPEHGAGFDPTEQDDDIPF